MSLADLIPWEHQLFAFTESMRLIEDGENRICITSPTGGGKTLVMYKFLQEAINRGWLASVYTPRKMLVKQLVRDLTKAEMSFGVRAAGYPDQREREIQISSIQTEDARVFNPTNEAKRWQLHGEGSDKRLIILFDEAHIQKGEVAKRIMDWAIARGAVIIGVTATPIDLAEIYKTLVVAGTPSQLRKCQPTPALVPAFHYGPDEPDFKKLKKKRGEDGEFNKDEVKKQFGWKNKTIFSRVFDQYKILNPTQRPTILFAPGVQESIWFCEQLCAAGVRSAHIDGGGVWRDGEYIKCSPDSTERDDIIEGLKNGSFRVLCNRFVAREGLDIPIVSHIIFATVMGSLQSYIQSGGRGMRAAPGKDCVTIQDHGGHWWLHGSLNEDRDWDLSLSERKIAAIREMRMQSKEIREPLRCNVCNMIRNGSDVCPGCGTKFDGRKSRMVFQMDGTLKELTGDIYKERPVRLKKDTEEIWISCYWRARKSRNRMTFLQAEGLFFYENGYYPPRNLPFMPYDSVQFVNSVVDVPFDMLYRKDEVAIKDAPKPSNGQAFFDFK